MLSAYSMEAFLHLVAGVLLVGQCLFWVVMAVALGRETGAQESVRLLETINRGAWPPVGVPRALRLSLPVLGWCFLLALGATGGLLVARHAPFPDGLFAGHFGHVLAAKMALFCLLLVGHAIATFRPRRGIAFVNGALALLIVGVSALLRH